MPRFSEVVLTQLREPPLELDVAVEDRDQRPRPPLWKQLTVEERPILRDRIQLQPWSHRGEPLLGEVRELRLTVTRVQPQVPPDQRPRPVGTLLNRAIKSGRRSASGERSSGTVAADAGVRRRRLRSRGFPSQTYTAASAHAFAIIMLEPEGRAGPRRRLPQSFLATDTQRSSEFSVTPQHRPAQPGRPRRHRGRRPRRREPLPDWTSPPRPLAGRCSRRRGALTRRGDPRSLDRQPRPSMMRKSRSTPSASAASASW